MATTVKHFGDSSISKIFKIVKGWLNALPTYSAGNGISIGADGKISATGTADVDPSALPDATKTTKGAVKIGDGINVADGVISVPAKSFKTINGESVEGTGNITIDLSLYKVVASLPTENIEDNKIYLVQSTETVPEGELNVYVEWIHVSGKWEKVGEYKTAVDLTPYAKTADVNTAIEGAKTELSGTINSTKNELNAEIAKKATPADVATAKSEAIADAATAAAGLYMNKTDLAATYQTKADMPTFSEYTEAEIQAIADAAVAAL